MKPLLTTGLHLTILVLSGCATAIPWDGEGASIRVGMTQAEIEAAFGAPDRISVSADGQSIRSYSRPGPRSASMSSGAEQTVTFAGAFVTHHSHSTTTRTTTTIATPG